MKTKYFLILCGFLVVGAVILLILNKERKGLVPEDYSFVESNKNIDLKNTSWEFVQYTLGSEIKNLVGTDWVLQFNENTGNTKMCSKQKFAFISESSTVTVKNEYMTDVLCSASSTDLEKLFYKVLSEKPKITLTESQGQVSKVLTISNETIKFSFIPRVELDFSGENTVSETTHKTVLVTVFQKECVKKDDCQETPFQGSFIIKKVSGDPAQSSEFIVDQKGETSLSLEPDTYQIDLKDQSQKKFTMNPVIFSVKDTTQKDIQSLRLLVVRK